MDQFDAGKPCSVVSGKQQIEGGHYVPLVGLSRKYLLRGLGPHPADDYAVLREILR